MDIEEDIKRCEQLIKPENANWIGISNQLAVAHIVDRIKELEVLEDDLKDKRVAYIDTPEFAENYIPKQKVKESYLNMEKEYARKVYDDNYNRNEVKKRINNMYKSKKQLMQELEEQKKTTAKINQERLSLLKNREINYNLYNMLKAVLMQLPTMEIAE